jgi:hypothetical protein
MDRALAELPTTVLPATRSPIAFPVRIGSFVWDGGVGAARLDGSTWSGSLRISGPRTFLHGEHADLVFEGAPDAVPVPPGEYATVVQGQRGSVRATHGLVCEYTWTATGRWAGGCR